MATRTKTGGAVREDGDSARFYEVPPLNGDGASLRFPSVTTILKVINKPALVPWAAKVERELVLGAATDLYAELAGKTPVTPGAFAGALMDRLPARKAHAKETEKACSIGSNLHAVIEAELRRELRKPVPGVPALLPDAVEPFTRYQEWRETTHFKPYLLEQTVWSRRYRYAGTLDWVAEPDHPEAGRITALGDWKSGKAIYEEALLQNAAYVHALREMGHADENLWGCIVRFPKQKSDPGFEVRFIEPARMAELLRVFRIAYELWKWTSPAEAERVGPLVATS